MFCPRLVGKNGKEKLKMAKKSELFLFSKTSVQPSFSDAFRCFPMFFQVSTIINNYFLCFFRSNHPNNFFTTISDGCNTRCKQSSSTILRPGLHRVHRKVCQLSTVCLSTVHKYCEQATAYLLSSPTPLLRMVATEGKGSRQE